MTSLNICVSSHGETKNLKFGQPGNPIQRVLLGTPPPPPSGGTDIITTYSHDLDKFFYL